MKHSAKILSFVMVMMMALGVLGIFTMMPQEAYAAEETATIDLAAQGFANAQAVTDVSEGDVKVTFAQGSASNAPAYYTSGTAVRVYAKGTFTVTASGNRISKIVLTYGSSDKTNAITTNVGSFNTNTWTGDAESVIFTIGGTKDHRRIKSITVTYDIADNTCTHANTTDIGEAKDATCTEDGITAGVKCADANCGAILEKQAEIPALGHTTDNGVCDRCGETIGSQGGESGGNTESGWILTDIADIKADDIVVIVWTKGDQSWAVSNDKGTGSAPTAVVVTIDGDQLSGDIADNIKWNITNSNGNLTIYPNGTTATWLYCTSSNNGVRVGTNTNKIFTIDADSNYLKHTGTGRYLGVYTTNPDVRCYTSASATNIANQTLAFYVWNEGESSSEPEVPECNHANATLVSGTPATCTESGVYMHYECECGVYLDENKNIIEASTVIIPPAGHKEVIDEAVSPTCTTTGLTEGKHCEVCGVVTVPQNEIPVQHNYVNGTCTKCCVKTSNTTETMISKDQGYDNGDVVDSIEIGKVTIQFNLLDESTKYYNTGEAIRVYYGDQFSVTVPEGYAIASIVFTFDSGEGNNKILVDVGTLNDDTWTGNAQTVTFSVENTGSGHRRIAQMQITYMSASPEYNHSYGEWVEIQPPTCNDNGTQKHVCSVCGNEEIEDIPAKGHTEVIDAAVAPTCTETGLTEGKHCSVCNEVLVAQEVVDALGHTEVVDAAVAPSCTETGLTEGKHCSVCNEVLVAQEVVDALGHTEVVDAAVAPTCTETGLTEGKHCSVCNEVLVAQEEVAAKGHDWSANNGECANECGAVVKFNSASITLQDNLLVNFKINASALSEAGVSFVKAYINGVDVEGDLVFSYAVAPHQMADSIVAYFVFADANGNEYKSEETTYSVATYCMNKFNDAESSAELKALVASILNYGAAAQVATHYNTDNLANRLLPAESQKIGEVSANAVSSQSGEVAEPSAIWVSAGLILQDKIVIRFAFEAESVEGLTVNAVVNGITYNYGVEKFVKVEGIDNRYYVYIEGLNATQLRDAVCVTVMNGNEAVSSTLSYSVEVYAAKVFAYAGVEGYENLVNLVKAMMVYGDAASAYIAK